MMNLFQKPVIFEEVKLVSKCVQSANYADIKMQSLTHFEYPLPLLSLRGCQEFYDPCSLASLSSEILVLYLVIGQTKNEFCHASL